MIIDIKIPSPGESITEVEIAAWMVADGDIIAKDQEVAEIESDKATLPLIAPESGKISIKIQGEETAEVGAIACTIDTSFAAQVSESSNEATIKTEEKKAIVEEKIPVASENSEFDKVKVSPVAKKLMNEYQLSVDDVIAGLKRIGKQDIEMIAGVPNASASENPIQAKKKENSRDLERKKMSSLRRKISERLVSVKNETAMLTTFNEVDMSNIMQLRKSYQKQFVEKHGIKLGFMSFFTKACATALKAHPAVNAQLDGEEILYHNYADIGIAVQTPKGLMVPVLRNTENLSLAGIEQGIKALADKARAGRISLDDLSGGTFTITNGGVFGSMLSTPIINPPQSAILGMHNIVERPVAINGKVEIRPIMYIALSYDHRIIDGKDSVGFLVKVKELLENPYKMLFEGQQAEKLLFEL